MVGLYYSASRLAGRASAPYVLPSCTRVRPVRVGQLPASADKARKHF